MQVSTNGIAMIKHFEGFSARPYRCPAGYTTIGYGHVIRTCEKDRLVMVSQSDAEMMLQQDLSHVVKAIERLMHRSLHQHQWDALASFTFNLGAGALQRSSLRRVINRGEDADAPRQFMRWVWGGGQKLPGLIRRRAAEAALYCQT